MTIKVHKDGLVEVGPTEVDVKTWMRTTDLRLFNDTPGKPEPIFNRLQQCWVCMETGEREWRNVPVIWEPRNV